MPDLTTYTQIANYGLTTTKPKYKKYPDIAEPLLLKQHISLSAIAESQKKMNEETKEADTVLKLEKTDTETKQEKDIVNEHESVDIEQTKNNQTKQQEDSWQKKGQGI
ncbi:MAG: hypothetical protein U9P80_09910 [Thermodesulfobacteriota bacterium]|nr:hypothetical protein [Thermodesulfobacteriota bacterium]